jgi:hypothetical protein
MALRRRRSGALDFGRTIEYVLAHRPCRVIVSTPPAPVPARGDGYKRRPASD